MIRSAALLLLAPAIALGQTVPEGGVDSAGVVVDSVGTAPLPEKPAFVPDPIAWELATFRLSRSTDVGAFPFRGIDDPVEPIGALSLAEVLRLVPGVRTRELSPGPTVESFELRGGGTGRAPLVWPGVSLTVPGTSGPHTHELMLSEIARLDVLSGGGAALYGPEASSGAVVVRPREIHPDLLHSRAIAEEGVDDYQRGAFQVAVRIGPGSLFLNTESRRVNGFYSGTKEVDRHFSGRWRGRLPFGLEGSLGYRELRADGRSGFFDPSTVASVLTKRDDVNVRLFRRTGDGEGALLQVGWLRERLEDLGSPEPTREIRHPRADVTFDLPAVAGIRWTVRGGWARWKTEHVEAGRVDAYSRWSGALRATRPLGDGFLTATGRADREGGETAWQGRLEGEWAPGRLTVFGIVSRNERFPDRGAADRATEVHREATAGGRLRLGPVSVRVAGFGMRISALRPDPTFVEIQRRAPVLGRPVGTGEIAGATAGFETGRFELPGLRPLGRWRFRSSATLQRTEIAGTGARLPGRPARIWTGEGLLEHRFFKDELLARVRGRLTHYGDRVDFDGLAVRDAWLQDVALEAEIGDAVLFYRFHDLLERGDEVEPGIFFPGFSRYYGITWRFTG